jgi:hypothetical protein
MQRRHRNEFVHLEAQLDPYFREKAWRHLIDTTVHGKDLPPHNYAEQFRLAERLRTRHSHRDRYNAKRIAKRREAFRKMLGPRHVMAALAIRAGMAEAARTGDLFELLAGAWCIDRRKSRRLLQELEAIHETIHPKVSPWELDHRRIHLEAEAVVFATLHEERREFDECLKPVMVPESIDNEIPFPTTSPAYPNAPQTPATAPAASAAS